MGLISITILWIFKNYLLPELIYFEITFFEIYRYSFEIPNLIFASFAGLIARLGLEGIVESFFEDLKLKLPLNQSEASEWILLKDNGEGSSSQNPPPKKGGVIGPEDFIYDSDTESESRCSMDEDNKATGDDVKTFEQRVENMTSKEDVSSVKEQMNNALDQYKSSGYNVPAFKEQVSDLEKKIKICDSKLSELERKEQTEGKGKAKETNVPERVINPNYQPAPKSSNVVGSSTVGNDYSYNSDEEDEAIRRAIAESIKTESSKENSSKSGKGKGKDE